MTKYVASPGSDAGTLSGSDDHLAGIQKAAGAVVQLVKRLRLAEDRGSDAISAHAALGELREQLTLIQRLATKVAEGEALLLDRAETQFLELESAIREGCTKHGWRIDGQWPTLYVERAITIEVSEQKRTVAVAGRKLGASTAEAIIRALEPLVRELLPKGFSAEAFMGELAAAYDSTRVSIDQLPIFDLYRGLVVRAQGLRFWRDARADAFVGLSADQFRARLSAMLEAGVTSTTDAREIRLLPPLNAKDGLFMYQPSESRFGFVGRVEFVRALHAEAAP